MSLPISVGLKLNQPLAAMLDRVFVDVAIHGNSLVDAFRDVIVAFGHFSSLPESAMLNQNFRSPPLCFAPVLCAPSSLRSAVNLGSCFAYRIGKLLEERLDMPPAVRIPPVEPDNTDLAARTEQLMAQSEELLRSGVWENVVLGHRILLRAQDLCALLAFSRSR